MPKPVMKAVLKPVPKAGVAATAKSQPKPSLPARPTTAPILSLPPASPFGTARIKAGKRAEAVW
jgi:hypothetical protein